MRSEARVKAQSARKRTAHGCFAARGWTAEQEEHFRASYPNTSARRLAVIFGIAERTVWVLGSEMGLGKAIDGTGRAVLVGSRHKGSNGYWDVKLGPRKWKRLHRVLWEQQNGPVPYGHRLVFRDGDKDNCAPSNMELITNAEMLARNKADA